MKTYLLALTACLGLTAAIAQPYHAAYPAEVKAYLSQHDGLIFSQQQPLVIDLDHCDSCVLIQRSYNYTSVVPERKKTLCQRPLKIRKRKWWRRRYKPQPPTSLMMPRSLTQVGDRYLIRQQATAETSIPQFVTDFYRCTGHWDTARIARYAQAQAELEAGIAALPLSEWLERDTTAALPWLDSLRIAFAQYPEHIETRLPLRTRWRLLRVEHSFSRTTLLQNTTAWAVKLTPVEDAFILTASDLYATFEIQTDSLAQQAVEQAAPIQTSHYDSRGYVPQCLGRYLMLHAASGHQGSMTDYFGRTVYYWEIVDEE